METRKKIVALAQKIASSSKEFTQQDPEYYALECVVTDEHADVALQMDVRVPISPLMLSQKSGKSLEDTTRILEELLVIGVVEATREHGELEYTLPIFVPGVMEFMVMNVKQVEKYPQIARAFEQLSLQPLKGATPMIPVGGGGLGMHVIPVEQAIPAETKTATYEQLSHWLKKYDKIAVGDCSCRISRRLMSEGCGHLLRRLRPGSPFEPGVVVSGHDAELCDLFTAQAAGAAPGPAEQPNVLGLQRLAASAQKVCEFRPIHNPHLP